ncbi:MAG: NAD(P)H-dependent oxidoreductase subunit E [Deltaproteobacteria bacterium]|nr:NAD(P)H-dependent oxidoreductase subunit E [Deltaproteobacteria bacterium]
MDLRHLDDAPSEDERDAVDRCLQGQAEPAPRHLLLPCLHALQGRVGWVSRGGLGYLCRRLELAPAEVFGVASFYALFALSERPREVLHVCDDLACGMRGAPALTQALGADSERKTWFRSPCLGLCEQAPAVLRTRAGASPEEHSFGHVTAEGVLALPAGSTPHPRLPQYGEEGLRLLRRVGRVDPSSLDDYRAHGGFQALRRALEVGPDAVLREVSEAGLVGRGGAAFPTGRKWEAVARATRRPHYVVCNADESEPGTFKDRVVLEEDPFALVEAMTLAGFATGSHKGWVYVRAEYPRGAERVHQAIAACRARGLLGEDILGRGLTFDIEVRRGAGAYICGEETALFNSLEGFRGEPRSKPPFPVESGLFGCPTVINNVETLVNVPDIILHGARWWRSVGTQGSPGTRLFCLSGAVQAPGLYEHPFGVTLRAVIDRAGGVKNGGGVQAVLLGGAAGTFVGPDELDLPLTFEDTRKAGATLGSGVVLVVDTATPLAPLLRRIAAFFRDESCGQCVPCRVGTVRQEELLHRLCEGRPLDSREAELERLGALGQVLRDASICGLGQTASSAIESAVRKLKVL